ncbi:MAG: T9SS C-terminal target domain-containing protein [Bacteroidetes bacterium]|nr:MAG: T9SS C-terminal target domain-containing protein [Bacteroidota bacterium]
MQFLLFSKRFFFTILLISALSPDNLKAATLIFKRTIDWQESTNITRKGVTFPHFVTFFSANHYEKDSWLPIWGETFRLNLTAKDVSVRVRNIQFGKWQNNAPVQGAQLLKGQNNFNQQFFTGFEQGNTVVAFTFLPIQYVNGENNGLPVLSFEVEINYTPELNLLKQLGKKSFTTKSVLSEGVWYKLAVTKTGFHKLDRNFFESNGINTAGIDPRTIKIYGNGPGILPQRNASPRIDDLKENAIIVEGESDGVFNAGDYVIMYGKSQFDVWEPNGNYLERQKNIYADTTYYFLTFGNQPGKRIVKQSSMPIGNSIATSHMFCYYHELDMLNVGKTGRNFVGESFERVPQQNFTVFIDGLIPTEQIRLRSATAAKSNISTAVFDVSVNGNNLLQHVIGTIGTGYEDPYYLISGPLTTNFQSTVPQINIGYKYNQPPGGAIGWLDFFELNAKASLTWSGSQVLYRFLPNAANGPVEYRISNALSSSRIFNVSNPTEVEELMVAVDGSGIARCAQNAQQYSELAGISNSTSYWVPAMVGKLQNQNLHGLSQVKGLYITPDVFYDEAVRLAAFHKQNGINIHVVRLNEIYNEFSCGAQDISGIRDFIRMFYLRNASSTDTIKYVTFFGRASYDYKYRVSSNSNFVPTFQSPASESPLNSYCSDDYFGLLDENEGTWGSSNELSREFLDIGIGRLPISSAAEATAAVNKIIAYKQPDKMADWRNKIAFVADDGDINIHQIDADVMANNIITRFKNYNVKKIWIDAYREEVVAGGQRYPAAQKAINEAVQKGSFIINYTGHGGELGWAEERILTIEDINGWNNADRLPLFVTATCEFSRFDDPARISAGELTFLNTQGGTIGLLTTTRLVSAFSNTQLNTKFYDRVGLGNQSKSNPIPLGEIIRLTKNDYLSDGADRDNVKNFTLLGDAVLVLAYPQYNVSTTSINNKAINEITDTLKALSKVTVTGAVTDINNQVITSFNGTVFPTVYDKPTAYKTLGNGGEKPMDFSMQNNIIYNGQASVTNGLFSFTFIVPKDISYQVGKGKISYYAHNSVNDANGHNENFVVGGTSDSALDDKKGPEIRLFMEDEKFVFGGLTDENPLFIGKLFDENGINTIGRGIGRELMLIVDGNNAKAIPVNDYYKGRKDSYQEGEVLYQLKNIEQGKHTITLRGWDTYNNSNEATTEFVVAKDEKMALEHVLNYPNPFTTSTVFHFDHNKAGSRLSVMIQIYTVSGKLAKTLSTELTAATSHFSELKWDGLDDFGDKLAKGVYVYKVKVKSEDGKQSEAFQKLVILN